MIRRLFAVVILIGVVVAPLRADLQYTIRTEAHPSTVAPTGPGNPLFTMLSSLVLGMIAPPGGTEMTVTVGEHGTRVDYPRAFAMVPAGGSVIVLPDGEMVVLNQSAKTFWKAPRLDVASGLNGTAPSVTIQRTGTFASVAGVRAEHAAVEIKVALPAAAALPGLPPDLVMSGDAWFSDAHKRYVRPAGVLSGLAGSIGLDGLSDAGFLMRSVLRSELFGQQELESLVTNIRETDVPPAMFQVPEGFTEVPPPALGGIAPTRIPGGA